MVQSKGLFYAINVCRNISELFPFAYVLMTCSSLSIDPECKIKEGTKTFRTDTLSPGYLSIWLINTIRSGSKKTKTA